MRTKIYSKRVLEDIICTISHDGQGLVTLDIPDGAELYFDGHAMVYDGIMHDHDNRTELPIAITHEALVFYHNGDDDAL